MFGKWLIVKKDFKSHVASYMYLKPSFVCIYYQISTRTVWIVQGETEIGQVCHQTHQMDWYLFISQRQALITNQSLASQLEMVQVSTEDQGVQLHSRMEHQRILCHSQVQAAWVDMDKALFRITHLRLATLKVQLKDLLLRNIQDLTWFPPQVSWKEIQNKTKTVYYTLQKLFWSRMWKARFSLVCDYAWMQDSKLWGWGQNRGYPYHCVLIQYTVSQISGVSTLRRYDSDASITDSSSMVSGPRSSVLSDGRSSMVSITQGSYVPDSYLTDGYESEPYLTSIGSSASRAAFRLGKDSPKSRWEKSTFP